MCVCVPWSRSPTSTPLQCRAAFEMTVSTWTTTSNSARKYLERKCSQVHTPLLLLDQRSLPLTLFSFLFSVGADECEVRWTVSQGQQGVLHGLLWRPLAEGQRYFPALGRPTLLPVHLWGMRALQGEYMKYGAGRIWIYFIFLDTIKWQTGFEHSSAVWSCSVEGVAGRVREISRTVAEVNMESYAPSSNPVTRREERNEVHECSVLKLIWFIWWNWFERYY